MSIASVIRGNKNKPQELKNDPWAKLQVFNVSGRFTYDPKEGGGGISNWYPQKVTYRKTRFSSITQLELHCVIHFLGEQGWQRSGESTRL